MPYINGSIIENFISLSWEVEEKKAERYVTHTWHRMGRLPASGWRCQPETLHSTVLQTATLTCEERQKEKFALAHIQLAMSTTTYMRCAKRLRFRKGFGYEKVSGSKRALQALRKSHASNAEVFSQKWGWFLCNVVLFCTQTGDPEGTKLQWSFIIKYC